MLPSVVNAYAAEGYRVRLGSPRVLTSGVRPIGAAVHQYDDGHSELDPCDMGFTMRDLFAFQLIGAEVRPQAGIIIGNAFGMSVACIGAALAPIRLDAIDGEGLGEQSRIGAALTRRVAERLGVDLQLTHGFSPQDLPRAMRFDQYGLAFVDGLHTDEQIVEGFRGIADRLADRAAVYFHDIGVCRMDEGWERIKEIARPMGFSGHDLTFTDTGSALLLRGAPELEDMLATTCPGLREFNESYSVGAAWGRDPRDAVNDVHFISSHGRIGFYGAGNDLTMYREFIERRADVVAAIFDDDPSKWGARRFGASVCAPAPEAMADLEAIVISTRSQYAPARAAIERMAPHVKIWPCAPRERPVELHIQEAAPIAPAPGSEAPDAISASA